MTIATVVVPFLALLATSFVGLSGAQQPTESPTRGTTPVPSTRNPSWTPSRTPSTKPTKVPSGNPTLSPSDKPSGNPTFSPSSTPTVSSKPSSNPSTQPSAVPSGIPSSAPSPMPSVSMVPSAFPSTGPSMEPSVSMMPSTFPSVEPSMEPSVSMAPSGFPSPRPTRRPIPPSPGNDDGDEDDDTPIGLIVITMLVAVVITICCGCRGPAENMDLGPEAAEEFLAEIRENNRLILTIPAFTLCGCSFRRRRFALFFSSRIKAKWLPLHTFMQMALGWIGLATTVIALFVPENKTNNVVGFSALFMNELLTNTWYGYIRHLFRCCRDEDLEDEDHFSDTVRLFSILFHRGVETEPSCFLDVIGFPFYAIMYVTTVIGAIMAAIPLAILAAFGRGDGDGGGEVIGAVSAFAGIALGCFAYPIMFLLFTTASGKVFASFMHHGMSEYYEAKLFNKSPWEYLTAMIFKVFGDFVGADELIDGDVTSFQEALLDTRHGADAEQLPNDEEDPDPANFAAGFGAQPDQDDEHPQQEAPRDRGFSAPPPESIQLIVMVPVGPMGLTMGQQGPNEGLVVDAVKPASPLQGLVEVGDELIMVNNIDLTELSEREVMEKLRDLADQERTLTLLREGPVESTTRDGGVDFDDGAVFDDLDDEND